MNYFIHLREKTIFKKNFIKILDNIFQMNKITVKQNVFTINFLPNFIHYDLFKRIFSKKLRKIKN